MALFWLNNYYDTCYSYLTPSFKTCFFVRTDDDIIKKVKFLQLHLLLFSSALIAHSV